MAPLIHIVGARPNFMKVAPVHAALAARGVEQRLVHTGQHYDEEMSDIFFRQLGMPEPDVNLGVGSGSHSHQTAALLTALEKEFMSTDPAAVVVYGDVNSTLAAALVCAKEHIPLVHVEAGLRSFDRGMPEEVNRVLTDAVSDLLLVTSPEAYAHLADEGVDAEKVRFVGNPMIDTLETNRDRFDPSSVLEELDLVGKEFAVATLHRPSNVDDPEAATELVRALGDVAARLPIIFPLHPRGRERFRAVGLMDTPGIHVVDPLGYLEFMGIVRDARIVLTDSGGVQEETTILRVPCLTLRPNTERPITITHGTNRLVTTATLLSAVEDVLATPPPTGEGPPLWDGRAGERIADELQALIG